MSIISDDISDISSSEIDKIGSNVNILKNKINKIINVSDEHDNNNSLIKNRNKQFNKSYHDLNSEYLGKIVGSSGHNNFRVFFEPTENMVINEYDIINQSYIICSAMHAALSFLDKEDAIVSNIGFSILSPIKLNESIEFKVETISKVAGRVELRVLGHYESILILEGAFTVLFVDMDIYKLDLDKYSKSKVVKIDEPEDKNDNLNNISIG